MSARAVIFGCGGPALTPEERQFFAESDPWGFILFGRNVESPDQLRRLTAGLRDAVGRDAPILIDQEGGRVARMRAPHWREWFPAAVECRSLPSAELRVRAMRLRYRLIAEELASVGIDVNCAPVLDVVSPDTHAILADRCYGDDPAAVAAIGRAVAEGLIDGGVLPVIKHIPGQGRAPLDSHLALPRVSDEEGILVGDLVPFRALADLPMAMTAHVIYTAIDPEAPATQSPAVIRLIRDEIGFDGLLMTDDLSMRALSGDFATRVTSAIAAGCDIVLHCNGDPAEMAPVAEAAPRLVARALRRAEAALDRRQPPSEIDAARLEAEFAALTGTMLGVTRA